MWHGIHRARRALLVLVVICANAPVAASQPGSDGEKRRRKASEHVKNGDAFKDAGDFDAAASEYQKAYALVPHPVLFFNLAQVYRLGGDKVKALDYYERYVVEDPTGRASRQARQFIEQLRREIERERGPGEPAQPEPSGGPDAEPGPSAGPVGSVSRSTPQAGRGLRIAGLASAGVGLIAIGVGVKFGLDARSISNDINAHASGEWPEELLARQADGERAERNMFILTGAGAAAIAAGGLLYYLGHSARRDATERPVSVTPVAAGDLVGLAVGGAF